MNDLQASNLVCRCGRIIITDVTTKPNDWDGLCEVCRATAALNTEIERLRAWIEENVPCDCYSSTGERHTAQPCRRCTLVATWGGEAFHPNLVQVDDGVERWAS